MNIQNTVKNKILFRVYFVWFIKRIIPIIILQIALLAGALKIFAGNVWVKSVLDNASIQSGSGYPEFLKYLVYAFLNTKPMVQIVVIIGLGVGALIFRDLVRALVTYVLMWRK